MFRLSNYLHRGYSQTIDCIWKFTYTALKCPPKKVQPICELSLYEIMIVKPRSSHALKSRLILCINLATERVKLLLMQQTKIQKICIYDRFSLRNLNKPNPKVWCCKTWFMKPKSDSSTATVWFSSKVQISRSWTNMLI
jgi:hypothetical protein